MHMMTLLARTAGIFDTKHGAQAPVVSLLRDRRVASARQVLRSSDEAPVAVMRVV